MAWCEAITHGKSWDQERDTKRIRDAFATLAATSDAWPSPRTFLAAIPPPPRQHQLSRIGTDERRASGMRHIAEICKQLGIER